MDFISTRENTKVLSEVNKHGNLIPRHKTDEIITNIEKLTLTIPNTDFNYTNNKPYFSIINAPLVCKNNTTKFENNITTKCVTLDHQTNACSKIAIKTFNIQIDKKKNDNVKKKNNKQKNISFSYNKLWEINRVNQILHNKISNGVKSTYTVRNPSACLVKATSTINREQKNKDILKRNEVSLIYVYTNVL